VSDAVWIEKDAVEKLILEQIDGRYGNPQKLSAFLNEIQERWRRIVSDQEAAVDEEEKRIARARKKAEQLVDEVEGRLEEGQKVPEFLYDRLGKLEEEVKELEANRPERVFRTKPRMPSLQQLLARYQKFTHIMAQGTPDEQRDMVRTFVHRVELDPEAKRLRLLMYEEPSLIFVVAGAGSAALEKTRTMRWMCELPFDALGRVLDAFWEEARLRLRPVAPGRKRR
jgi:uncharacterized protein YicC (UPF0701 family)